MESRLDAGPRLPALRWWTLVSESKTRCQLPRDSQLRVNRVSQPPSLYSSSVILGIFFTLYKYEASEMGLWWERNLTMLAVARANRCFDRVCAANGLLEVKTSACADGLNMAACECAWMNDNEHCDTCVAFIIKVHETYVQGWLGLCR